MTHPLIGTLRWKIAFLVSIAIAASRLSLGLGEVLAPPFIAWILIHISWFDVASSCWVFILTAAHGLYFGKASAADAPI